MVVEVVVVVEVVEVVVVVMVEVEEYRGLADGAAPPPAAPDCTASCDPSLVAAAVITFLLIRSF